MDDWEKEGLKCFEKQLSILAIICFAFGVGYFLCNKEKTVSHPVEEIVKADSLIKVNDSLKIKVNELDSIKDAKIIEVQTLDNDSTIKLFYELISKQK